MKPITKHILLAAALTATATAAAQSQTGYFLEDYTYRYQLNPAMANSRNFVSLPALANINCGVNGTLGLSDVLYNVDGRTTTFLNPGVSAQEALSNIGDKNTLGVGVKATILAAGFAAYNGYNTITIGVRADARVKLPGSVFRLLKEGVANQSYDIGDIDAYGRSYLEIALGHSRDINPEWRVGANVKLLLGIANLTADMQRANLTLGTDAWTIESQGEMRANLKGMRYDTDVNDNTGHRYVSGIVSDDIQAGMTGFGLGVDLGAVYSPSALPDFKFSASLTDLGYISWSNTMVASTKGVRTFTTDKYTFNVDGDAPNSFDNEIDRIKDDLSALYELDDLGDQGSTSTGLGATMHLGGQYTLPMYKPLTVGLLNSTRFNGEFGYTEFRLSANWAPSRHFDAAVSGAAGTYGMGFGWMLNLHVPGFNMFVGSDYTPGKLAKQGIPLRSNGSFNLGINFLF